MNRRDRYLILKRIFDTVLSFLSIIVLLPVFLIVALVIILTMGTPVFFRQERIGQGNKPFSIFKFRTMRNANDVLISDSERVTKFGLFLRKFSIDEFPQIFNIFMGQMSFIGPRPLLKKYLPYYTTEEIKRHEVKPGMSGLGQVNGRSSVTWDDQFRIDSYYAENLSLSMDIKIFLKTIPKVLGSVDMMVIGRIDTDPFDIHREKQIKENKVKRKELNQLFN